MKRLCGVAVVVTLLGCAGCGDDGGQATREPTDEQSTSPVVWRIEPGRAPRREDRTFRVDLRGVACDDGRRTSPLAPTIEESDQEVVIRFSEPALGPGFHTCEGNVEDVEYWITLEAPIGTRRLIDAECQIGSQAFGSGLCDPNEVRYQDGQAVRVVW